MRPALAPQRLGRCALLLSAFALWTATLHAAEPDPKTYWDINDIRPGMKGIGKTVMVGTALEEFEAEVLGVLRDVSPGRDMVLCKLKGCKLEHFGIIQGMSGSPIYIDGKLLGAVAYAWEFAKEPIAGVTPFKQMVQYVRSNDRRIAAEAKDRDGTGAQHAAALEQPLQLDEALAAAAPAVEGPTAVSGGGLAGMKPIATPLAASGFSPRALAFLAERLGPLGMAPMAGGAAQEEILKVHGDKPLEPGSPLSIAMITGDFDLSGIGTVTHVEGDRVYGFGHPMFSLGACEFPLMTGYIHTVYPRASVSMKMGSPLKVVGVLDTDVSTAVAGRIGPQPDMLPMSVQVKVGRYSDPRTYHVEMVRERHLLPTLVMAVLTNAIDTEGNLPEELTAHITAEIKLKDHDPIRIRDTLSGPRYTGPMGTAALFGPIANIVNLLMRNPMAPVRIESITCEVDISSGRTTAEIESIRLASDRLEPGQTLRALVTLKPYKGERQTIAIEQPLPIDLAEGTYEVTVCDMAQSLRRRFRNEPHLLEPRDLEGVLRVIHFQNELVHSALHLHLPLPDRGLAVQGQALPNLPSSARAVFANGRHTPPSPIRSDLVQAVPVPWVVEGTQSLKFTVVKDAALTLRD
ncbi:MAG: SpoIVB peptidase S55 [Isosphaeraceae bacterium]|nr:SpoIVB peptidase S55 [Isosphaeraceae bacterium]